MNVGGFSMMARSALKHLALAGMVGAGAVFGVKEAKAEPIEWGLLKILCPMPANQIRKGNRLLMWPIR
jgi:hypothetical protein